MPELQAPRCRCHALDPGNPEDGVGLLQGQEVRQQDSHIDGMGQEHVERPRGGRVPLVANWAVKIEWKEDVQ